MGAGVARPSSPTEHRERAGKHAHRQRARAEGLAIGLRRQLALKLDIERARAEGEDVTSVHVRPAIQLRERDQRCPPPEITGYDDIEEPIVDLRFGSDMHAA